MIKLESFVMPHQMISRDVFINSRDMCISPALLDFLEQAMEPFELIKVALGETNAAAAATNAAAASTTTSNLASKFRDEEKAAAVNLKKKSAHTMEDRAAASSANEQQQQTVATASYFPIDVIVFISMLPSSIRFTCLPQSTMECLLKLPSVEMVFSTNRIDEQAQGRLANLLKSDKFNEGLNCSETPIRDRIYSEFSPGGGAGSNMTGGKQNVQANVNEGGLSLTCSMTDFSLKFYNRLAIRQNFDQRFYYSENLCKLNLKKKFFSRIDKTSIIGN